MQENKQSKIKSTVLIVDDSRDTGLLIGQALGNKGYHVLTATTPKEAHQIFQENENIRLILIDINLEAEINGIALAKQFNDFKQDRLFTMCFVSGAKVDQSFIEAAHKIGVDGYISKPINLERLQNKVEELLGISLDEPINSPKIKCHLAAELVNVNIIPVIRLIQITQSTFLLMSSADFVQGAILNLHCPALHTVLTERIFTIKVLRSKRNKRLIEQEMPFIVRCQIIEMNHYVKLSLASLFVKNAVLPEGFELLSETKDAS
ncbi:MAG: response regulator [Proteobacteria bacterium]|nr:response regulator [Pseudomonadota bacterium]